MTSKNEFQTSPDPTLAVLDQRSRALTTAAGAQLAEWLGPHEPARQAARDAVARIAAVETAHGAVWRAAAARLKQPEYTHEGLQAAGHPAHEVRPVLDARSSAVSGIQSLERACGNARAARIQEDHVVRLHLSDFEAVREADRRFRPGPMGVPLFVFANVVESAREIDHAWAVFEVAWREFGARCARLPVLPVPTVPGDLGRLPQRAEVQTHATTGLSEN